MLIPTRWDWWTVQQKVEEKWCESISCFIKWVFSTGLCVSRFLLEKSYSTENWKIEIKLHRYILQGYVAPHQNSGKKGSIAKRHSKMWTSWAQTVRSQVWGEDTTRNVAPRTTCPRSSMVFGEECLSTQKKKTKATFFSPSEVWSLAGPLQWQLLPLWGSWPFEVPVRMSLSPVCMACALMNEFWLLWLLRRGCQRW